MPEYHPMIQIVRIQYLLSAQRGNAIDGTLGCIRVELLSFKMCSRKLFAFVAVRSYVMRFFRPSLRN